MIFSIIIATCDRPVRLRNALDAASIAIQASGRRHRIIAVDNGSTQSAQKVVNDFAQDVDFPVQYLQSEPWNKSVALNAGIRSADTEWLAFTDDDALPAEDWLDQADEYRKRTGVNIFGGQLVAGVADFELPSWLIPGRSGKVLMGPTFAAYAPLDATGILDDKNRVPFGANVFVRKKVFQKYGGYDKDLWMRCGKAALGCEDAEFGMRVRARGELIGYCAEAIVVHPTYRERATLKYHLMHAYRTGIRETILFPGVEHRASVPHLLRSLVISVLRSTGYLMTGDLAASAFELMSASGSAGQICGYLMM